MAENEVMDKAGELLGRKYGPLPFGAWLGIIAVTAFVARKYVASNRNAKATASDEGYVVDSSGNKLASAYTGTAGGGTPFGTGVVTSAASQQGSVTSPTEIDNRGWLKRAADKIQAAGMWNPLDVTGALTKYITGEALNQREQAIVNQAITMEGQPPVSVYGGDTNGGSWGVTAQRIIQPAGNAGLFIEYSDGSVKWIQDINEYLSLKQSDPTKFGKIDVLPISDPIWRRSDVYANRSADYLAAEAFSKSKGYGSTLGQPSANTIYQLNNN